MCMANPGFILIMYTIKMRAVVQLVPFLASTVPREAIKSPSSSHVFFIHILKLFITAISIRLLTWFIKLFDVITEQMSN